MSETLIDLIYQNEKNNYQKVEELLKKGEDPNFTTEYDESPLRIASSLGRFDLIQLLLDSGADKKHLSWNDLFFEIAFGTIEKLKKLIQSGNDLQERDDWGRTPWLLAILKGDIDKIIILLNSGSDRNDRGNSNKPPLFYAIQNNDTKTLKWLLENKFDINAEDDFGFTPLLYASELGHMDCVKLLLDSNPDKSKKNEIGENAIKLASNLETVHLLLKSGFDLMDINEEMHSKLLSLNEEDNLRATRDEFLEARSYRPGKSNPELSNFSFWKEMIRTKQTAYRAREFYKDGNSSGPIWCYRRFGKSITRLNDGRYVEIAGEHEDFYDPDFCIYNDVIIHKGNGEIDIYIYPEEIFPPTDFHTATLFDNFIYIIDGLGYSDKRKPGSTPVYRLHLDNFHIENIITSGEIPGWISGHRAVLQNNSEIIVSGGHIDLILNEELRHVQNENIYSISLNDFRWRKIK